MNIPTSSQVVFQSAALPRPFSGFADLFVEKKEAAKEGGRYWSDEEHIKFLAALRVRGRNDAQYIAEQLGTKNITQVRSHT